VTDIKPATSSPIFVVGYFHSGTTLMNNILSKEPTVFELIDESSFFLNLGGFHRDYPNLADQATLRAYVQHLVKLACLGFVRTGVQGETYTLADLGVTPEQLDSMVAEAAQARADTSGDGHVVVFRTVVDRLAREAGRERWLEKTPSHVLYLDTIFETLPDAQVIEVVRDPRAVLASRKLRMRKEWQSTREKGGALVDRKLNFDPILDSLRWRQMVRAGARAREQYPGRIMRLRYEDLVERPEELVPKTTGFLGLNYSPDLLGVKVVNSTSWSSANKEAGIVKVAVDKWRETLTQEELYLIQNLLRPEMARLGYQPAAVSPSMGTYARLPIMLGESTIRLGGRLRRRLNIWKGFGG
jgi:hypothetical protein